MYCNYHGMLHCTSCEPLLQSCFQEAFVLNLCLFAVLDWLMDTGDNDDV